MQSDDQSKQQSSGNYGNYNRGSYRGRFNTFQGHEGKGIYRYRGFGKGQVSSSINKDQLMVALNLVPICLKRNIC